MNGSNTTGAALEAFATALKRLADALRQPKTEWTRDAAIQRFEFTFELAWKSTARAARREGLDCASPRQAWKVALRLGWIEDDAVWLEMLDDRNQASHTYNEQTAERIYSRLPSHAEAFRGLLEKLRTVNEPSQGKPGTPIAT